MFVGLGIGISNKVEGRDKQIQAEKLECSDYLGKSSK